MIKSMLRLAAVMAFACVLATSLRADEAAERVFTLKVQPLLKDKCLGCHGGDSDDIKGEFSVIDSRGAVARWRVGRSGDRSRKAR